MLKQNFLNAFSINIFNVFEREKLPAVDILKNKVISSSDLIIYVSATFKKNAFIYIFSLSKVTRVYHGHLLSEESLG